MFQDEEAETRDSLLRYFSAQANTHGTYILTTALVLFTALSILPKVVSLEGMSGQFIFLLTLSVGIVFGFRMTVRTIYWGTLTSTILWAKPYKPDTLVEKHPELIPPLTHGTNTLTLHVNLCVRCYDLVNLRHRILKVLFQHELPVCFITWLALICSFAVLLAFGIMKIPSS